MVALGITKEQYGEAALCRGPSPKCVHANWGFLSDYRNALFAVAIIGVLMFHLYGETSDRTIVHKALFFFKDGNMGVDAFLFMSGIGLYFSFSGDSCIRRFYAKRVVRMVPTFLVVAVPYFCWRDCVVTETATFLLDLLNISFIESGFRTFWYVYAIFLLYMVFPFLFKIIHGGNALVRTLSLIVASICASAAIGVIMPELYDNIEIALTRVPVFVAGCYVGKLVKERREINGWVVAGLCASIVAMYTLMFVIGNPFPDATNVFGRYRRTLAAVLCCIIFAVLSECFALSGENRFLNWFGTRSLELYISQVSILNVVNYYFGDYFSSSGNIVNLQYFLFTFALTCFAAELLHGVCKPLNNALGKLVSVHLGSPPSSWRALEPR